MKLGESLAKDVKTEITRRGNGNQNFFISYSII
jgi:hypothetical protein